jgi:hypothetical protein
LVGELLLTGTLLITPNVAISGGFTLVCLTDLPLALDQPGAIGWAAGPGYGQGIGDNGDVCYYGSVIGLIVTNSAAHPVSEFGCGSAALEQDDDQDHQ